MCLHFVSISIYFLFFNFEFYVVVNVLFGMTAYGCLIIQCGLLESLVSLTFNLPLFFVSMFQYQSWTIKHPTYHNPRLHHHLSSLLIDYTGMIRCPSVNISLSLWFLSNDIIYVFRYEIGRWRERSRWKKRNQLWFGILFSLQISNLIFDSSLQNFRPEFVHHSCSSVFGHGNFRFAQFLTLNTRFTLHLICLFARKSEPSFWFLSNTKHYDFELP